MEVGLGAHPGSWPWLLTAITQRPLNTTCSGLTELGSEFFGLGLAGAWGWLKLLRAGDAKERLDRASPG